jgi:hypothetical protein
MVAVVVEVVSQAAYLMVNQWDKKIRDPKAPYPFFYIKRPILHRGKFLPAVL